MTPAGYTCPKCGKKTADYLGNCWDCGPLIEEGKE